MYIFANIYIIYLFIFIPLYIYLCTACRLHNTTPAGSPGNATHTWTLDSRDLRSIAFQMHFKRWQYWGVTPLKINMELKHHPVEKENHRTHPPPLLWSMLFFEGKLLGRRSWWRCDLTEDDWSIVEVVVSWALLGVPWPLSSHWNSAKTTGCGHEMTLKKVRNVTKIFWALIIFLHLSVMYLFGANTSDLLIFATFQVLWKTEVPFWFVRV